MTTLALGDMTIGRMLENVTPFDAFAFLAGDWDVASRYRNADGEWEETTAQATITPDMGGCLLMERFRGTRNGEAISRVIAQQIGVVLVVPPGGDEEDSLAEELDERMGGARGIAWVVEGVRERGEETESLVEFAQEKDTGVGGEAVGASFDGE